MRSLKVLAAGVSALLGSSSAQAQFQAPRGDDLGSLSAEKRAQALLQAAQSPAPGQKGFASKECPRLSAKQWLQVLVMNEPVRYESKFSKECDIEGSFLVKRDGFPIDVKVRNWEKVRRLKVFVTPSSDPDLLSGVIRVTVSMAGGNLYGDSKDPFMRFLGSYRVKIGLNGAIQENEGGTIQVTGYQGKAITPAANVPFRVK